MRDNNKVSQNEWPVLDYDEWRQTGEALHLWSQIAGKYRLAHTPWINHSWHATLYVTLRGLTTGPIPDPAAQIDLEFDFRNHCLVAQANDGARESFALEAMSVADFYERTKRMISAVGGTPTMHGAPNEVSDPIPFAKDTQKRPYNAEAVQRFHQALLRIDQVFEHFRTSFVGKVSPVHLFWGSFDLAVTRFSGRPAPLHPGGIPNLPDEVTQEPTATRFHLPGSGQVAMAWMRQCSILTPIPSRMASRTSRSNLMERALTVHLGSFSYHTRLFERRTIRRPSFCDFYALLTRLRLKREDGIAMLLNVRLVNQACREQCCLQTGIETVP